MWDASRLERVSDDKGLLTYDEWNKYITYWRR
jgi:hypothetical protein